jgi:predicted flap endonuclease-1-like 5' DNA nuclease
VLRVRRAQIGDPTAVGVRLLGVPRAAPTRTDVRDLLAIKGVGERTFERLRDMGITSLDDVLAATPERIAELRGVTPAIAADWIAQARRLRRPT